MDAPLWALLLLLAPVTLAAQEPTPLAGPLGLPVPHTHLLNDSILSVMPREASPPRSLDTDRLREHIIDAARRRLSHPARPPVPDSGRHDSAGNPWGCRHAPLAGRGAPLYVVDGVVLEPAAGVARIGVDTRAAPNELNGLEAASIASIDLVNGAAAVERYGCRAVAGAVLITTKAGASISPP